MPKHCASRRSFFAILGAPVALLTAGRKVADIGESRRITFPQTELTKKESGTKPKFGANEEAGSRRAYNVQHASRRSSGSADAPGHQS